MDPIGMDATPSAASLPLLLWFWSVAWSSLALAASYFLAVKRILRNQSCYLWIFNEKFLPTFSVIPNRTPCMASDVCVILCRTVVIKLPGLWYKKANKRNHTIHGESFK